MVDDAVARFGRIDILICNAGTIRWGPFHTAAVSEIREVIETNLWGTLYPLHAVLPHMLDRGYGRIVLTSSTAGLYGQPAAASYCGSKAALIGFARGIACDIPADKDVRINVIMPAAFTQMSERNVDPALAEVLSPSKVAPVVGWLASEQCTDSGMLFQSGAGKVTRARIFETAPVDIAGEDVADAWPDLDDMTGGVEPAVNRESSRALLRGVVDLPTSVST